MFDVGIGELLLIVFVGIIVFGPDRLPEYARQLGRVVRQVRQFAQNAQEDLRSELGPEFADLKLADLDPRELIRKHVLEDLDDAGKPIPPLPADQPAPFDADAT